MIFGNKVKATASNVDKTQDFSIDNLNFAASEAYKRLRTNLLFSFTDNNKCPVVGITSSLRNEGKSTTAINLAYTMAQSDRRVLLIDADMRLPSVAKYLKLSGSAGLSNELVGLKNLGSTHTYYKSKLTGYGFDVLTAGELPPNPAELLGSTAMVQLLEKAKSEYDFIFIDLPPICEVSDALIISKVADGMMVVVSQDYCRTPDLKDAVSQLEFVKANIVGFVYNNASTHGGKYGKYGKYSKYGKYGKYYRKPYASASKPVKK